MKISDIIDYTNITRKLSSIAELLQIRIYEIRFRIYEKYMHIECIQAKVV